MCKIVCKLNVNTQFVTGNKNYAEIDRQRRRLGFSRFGRVRKNSPAICEFCMRNRF